MLKPEILIVKLVNRYIGVNNGYLADFTYKSHADFYPEYCGITKDLSKFPGTTRSKFIAIFLAATSKEQAQIIKGVIEKFPPGTGTNTRTEELKSELLAEAKILDASNLVNQEDLAFTSDTVYEALKDAEILINESRYVSAVDRVHTALLGYLRYICKSKDIPYTSNSSIGDLNKEIFTKVIKQKVPVGAKEIENIFNSFASIAHVLNPIRNNISLAHPNENLLEEPEANLVINAVRSILVYLNSRVENKTANQGKFETDTKFCAEEMHSAGT